MMNQNAKLARSFRNIAVKSRMVAALVFGVGAAGISAFI